MKLPSVLLIALALFVRGEPICATPQQPAAMSATECADMDGDKEQHQQDQLGMTGGCITCLFAQTDTPMQQQSLAWPKQLISVPSETPLDDLSVQPPTPPPRAGLNLKHSII
jgi:hypothetical protein